MKKTERPGGHTGIYFSGATIDKLEELGVWPAMLIRAACELADEPGVTLAAVLDHARASKLKSHMMTGPNYATMRARRGKKLDEARARTASKSEA